MPRNSPGWPPSCGASSSAWRSSAVEVTREAESPPGAKGVDVLAAGGLVVGLVNSSAVLQALVRTLQSWLSRHPGRSARLVIGDDSIEVTGISSGEQRRLIETWIARHSEPRDGP